MSKSRVFIHGYRCAATLGVLWALAANFIFASGHDLQRSFEIACLCLVAIVFLYRCMRRTLVPPGATSALLLAFLSLGAVSAMLAYSVRHAIFEWATLLLLIATIFTIADELIADHRRLPYLLHWVGIICGLYSVLLLFFYTVAIVAGFRPDFSLITIGFSSPRFLNHTQTALLPLLILLCVQAPRAGLWSRGWFLLAAFWWALLFATEARASFLSLAIGCGAAVVLRRAHARTFVVMAVWTATAGVVLYCLIYLLLPLVSGLPPASTPWNVVARTIANPVSDRMLLWKLSVKLIAAHPWLGVGPLHFAHEGIKLYAGAHPHNWALQIALEWGIPALLCALGVITVASLAFLRVGAQIAPTDLSNQNIFTALQVACAAIFIDGLLSGSIVMPQSQLAIALVLGVTCAWVRMQRPPQLHVEVVTNPTSRAILACLVSTGFCALIWSVAPEITRHAIGAPLSPAELAANPAAQWARMWQAGFF